MKGRPKTRISCGIYCWTNLVNNKRYVGYAQTIEDRKNVHIVSLRGNYHNNPHFQQAFNKYGESSFYFSILELCNPQDLCQNEYKWGTLLKTLDPKFGYNIQPFQQNGEAKRLSEDTKEKIRLANTGKKRVIKDVIAWKERLSKAGKGKKFKPRPFGDPRNKQIIDLNTSIIYNSMTEAAKALGICTGSIKYRLENPGRRQIHCKRTNLAFHNAGI